MSETALERMSGAGGFVVYSDTNAHTDQLESVVVNADAVFTAFEINNANVMTSKGLTGVTIKQGTFLPTDPTFKITKVTLASGSVIGYK